jgi:hypothetical protein
LTFYRKGAVSKLLIKSNDETSPLFGCAIYPEAPAVCNFAVNIVILDFASTPMYNFAVNIAILDFASTPMCNFAVNIAILDFASTPMYSFAVNIDFLDFTFSVSKKGKRLSPIPLLFSGFETTPFRFYVVNQSRLFH